MLEEADDIEFVGDLSIEDAKVLKFFCDHNSRVLEFGSGGSTQIFAQCLPQKIVSVETDHSWIERTRENLNKISHKNWTAPQFVPYDFFDSGDFNLIFIDGVPEKRLEFAMRAWPMLDVGGCMIFHDTRRFEYFKNMAWVMQSFFNEICTVEVNISGSNMSIIYKSDPVQYVNWNMTEGKPLWAYGAQPMPEGASLWKMAN